MAQMRFHKVHGVGNDFIVVDTFAEPVDEDRLPDLARTLCDRRLGIGGDGLILVLPSELVDFRMRVFNPDGGEAEMCGNGIRCFARFVHDHRLTTKHDLAIETLAGVKHTELLHLRGKVVGVRVGMGSPEFKRAQIPMVGEGEAIGIEIRAGDRTFSSSCLSVGNPHCVSLVDGVDGFPVERYGPLVERHELFPRRINAEFVQPLDPHTLRMRVWERGVGETMACGTGASAASVAAIRLGLVESPVTVKLNGGDLDIDWTPGEEIFMTGPAVEVFEGDINV
jgi:diaminopimelate epimerase